MHRLRALRDRVVAAEPGREDAYREERTAP
jgi:hypothetical protein